MLARVTHEMRQPLGAARSALQVIRIASDDDRRERALTVLDRQLAQISRLFDDLLEATRLRMELTVLHFERLDLRGVVEQTADAIRPQVVEKRQRLETRVPADPVWVDADWIRLQQALSNLLINGVRYTDVGGRLGVNLFADSGRAVVTVSDTGRGIPADLLPHVFEPFTTVGAVAERGLGVGLSVARELVELHGGTIRASSPGLGGGSQFVVTLPMRLVARPEATSRTRLCQ
jgi:signal transduction histidine kinase